MISVRQLLRYQLDFSTWAAERSLKAAASLTPEELTQDFKTSDKSVLGTLTHIYRAERIWLHRLQDKRVDFRSEGDDTLAGLKTRWPELRTWWAEWARGLSEESAAAEFTYSDLKGNPWTHPVWIAVLQGVHHSAHHRGQVMGFIRSLGHTPPNVDLITFSRERM